MNAITPNDPWAGHAADVPVVPFDRTVRFPESDVGTAPTFAGPQLAADFLRAVFSNNATLQPVHICSLGNSRADNHQLRRLDTRDPGDVISFVRKYDLDGRANYFAVGTLKNAGDARDKQHISEISCLWVDVDFKDIDDSRADVERKLKALPYPPSIMVFSGNGIHAYWLLTESIVDPVGTGEADRIEVDLRQLSDIVGGDLQVCEIARLMRLPGSHNSKRGEWKPVEVIHPANFTGETRLFRYDRGDLQEWFGEQSPVILRKQALRPRAITVGEDDGFTEYAKSIGFKPPIDVKKRLDGMMYMGQEDASIHETQIAVSSSMINAGSDIEEIVEILMEATKAAAGDYGKNWNWRHEEREIRRACTDWLKDPRCKIKPKPTLTIVPNEGPKPARPAGGGEVVSMAGAAAERALKLAPQPNDVTTIVADCVIKLIRQAGQDIMLSEGEVWFYSEGIWSAMTPAERQWIMTMIQDGFGKLNVAPKTNSINGAFKRLTEHPDLFQRKVNWSDGSVIVCQNGVLVVATREFLPHSPLQYARRKIGAEYNPEAKCPEFIRLLTEMFSDRLEDERQKLVDLFQEFFGAALAPKLLSREQRKALVLVGASRTGKTEVSYSLRSLMGSPIASPSVAEISGTFGLQSFYGAVAWIRDDAVNEGDELDAQRFKTIITGEPIDISRKGLPAVLGVALAMPVLLTANSLPRARDKSDAIYNRSLIVEMTKVFSDEEAHAMKKRLGVPPGAEAAMPHIFSIEGSGILNWSLEGLRRLMERGRYIPPASVSKATQSFKDDNNPVGEWVRTCVGLAQDDQDHFYCVSRDDLMCSYHGWQREQDGEAAKAMGARALFPRLRAAAPWADASTDAYTNDAGKRHVTGIRLTDTGLALWKAHREDGQQLRGGSVGSSTAATDVNKVRRHELRTRSQVEAKTSSQPLGDAKKPRF